MGRQGQAGPAQVFEVGAGAGVGPQVADGRVHPPVFDALECQQQHGRRPRHRLRRGAKDGPVAIVRPAGLERPVEQQPQPLPHPGVAPLPRLAKCQHRPARRLHPGERVLGPRPAEQAGVDVSHVRHLRVGLQHPAAESQQPVPDRVEIGVAEHLAGEVDEGRRPGRLGATAGEPVAAVRLGVGGERGHRRRLIADGQQGQAGGFELGRAAGLVAPAALGVGGGQQAGDGVGVGHTASIGRGG